MSIGTAMRNTVNSAINLLWTNVIITSYTLSSVDSGYSGQIETTITTTTEKVVPFEEINSIQKEKFGDLETGTVQLVVKYNTVLDISNSTKLKTEYQGDIYDIKRIQRFEVGGVLVAKILIMNRRID